MEFKNCVESGWYKRATVPALMPCHPNTTHPDTTDAMTPTSIMENHSLLSQSVPLPVAAVRLSLRRSLQPQLQQLCTDFFDEVDDFLFAGGRQGQFAYDCIYLKAMRELRAKQRLFEEALLRDWSQSLKSGGSGVSPAGGGERRQLSRIDDVFEKVEIDLALQAMQRKANKFYLPFIRQIDSMNEKYRSSPVQQVIASHALIESTMGAFAQAQNVFALDLDIRLIFIKLFEQKILMKMEKLFLDIINTLKNVNDESLVAAPRAAATVIRPRIFQELGAQLELDSDAGQSPASKSGFIEPPAGNSPVESTICPSGEKLLDNDDLNEIAKLMGTAQNEADNTMIERRLTDYFPEIEQLREGSPVELLLNGSYRSFAVSKNKSGSELYEISSKDDDIKITKSKLGLAISLQNGELRFPQSPSPAREDQETILETSPFPIRT